MIDQERTALDTVREIAASNLRGWRFAIEDARETMDRIACATSIGAARRIADEYLARTVLSK